MATRRYTFRLYPNKSQESKLFSARRLHAYLYNACIAHRRFEYKKNQKSVSYFEQQNSLPEFKKCWGEYKQLHSQSLQATVKRVDYAYKGFFQGLRGYPKFKSIRNYSGWTYPAKSGWKANTNGKHGTLRINDLKINLRMRGQAKVWGIPSTLTIIYRANTRQWFASITVNIPEVELKFGSGSDLSYDSLVAYDLGCSTALTTYNGKEFEEITNPKFTQKTEERILLESKKLRRKRSPNRKKRIKASSRWRKNTQRVSRLQRKCAEQRKNWQHQITSDIASRYDIGVTEKLDTKNMTKKSRTKKGRPQKAGLNKSILSVGFGELNKMLTYKIEARGGLMIVLDTKKIKPSQRCPNCGKVHKQWAELSSRYHQCDNCGFEIPRDKGSVMVMYNVATNQQKGLGTSLSKRGCFSSTSENKERKLTGSMKQLGQMKRQKSQKKGSGGAKPHRLALG